MRPDLIPILRLLERAYGKRPWRTWGDPVSVLVGTILSQNTSDVNSSAGYRRLRRRFRTWEAVANAPAGEIEKCIRVSGLSRVKAPRIREILRHIQSASVSGTGARSGEGALSVSASRQKDFGEFSRAASRSRSPGIGLPFGAVPGANSPKSFLERLASPARGTKHSRKGISLDFLRRMTPQAATDYLLGFQGVGPKTAACVLLFSLKMPVFPVDTHILRIAQRLGLAPARASAEDVQEALTPRIPPRRRYAMHVLLIEHGRRTCRARSPRCQWCPLLPMCPYGKKTTCGHA